VQLGCALVRVVRQEEAFMAADGWQVSAVWAAWTTAAIYAVLGGFAWVQVLQAKKLRESQALQARELREAEARPYVVVDFEPDRVPFVNMVIANLGRTMARNVRIEVDPPFDSSVYRSGPVPLARFKLFAEGIPALAPGKRIVLLFDQMYQRAELDLPDTYRVRLTYEWDGGDPLTDELRLDLDLYRPLRRIAPHTIHDVSETLDAIHRQFEKWTAGSEGGLLVLSPEDRRRRNEKIMAEMRTHRAAERAARNGRVRLPSRLLKVVGRLRRHD
jgi:hypothetical protein